MLTTHIVYSWRPPLAGRIIASVLEASATKPKFVASAAPMLGRSRVSCEAFLSRVFVDGLFHGLLISLMDL